MSKGNNDPRRQLAIKDINCMFGWAIFHLCWRKIKKKKIRVT